MKYGIREICDVVLRAKAKMTVGDKIFYKDEPVIYFDSLKTSSLEGTATTVYAQGGKGNSRLIAWEGERAITFTMEDALLSTLGLAILTGANVIEASNANPIYQHIVEPTIVETDGTIKVKKPIHVDSNANYIYVMKLDANGNCDSEPYIYTGNEGDYSITLRDDATYKADAHRPTAGDVVLVDYYTTRRSQTQQLEITADQFGGNFYLEASTLFRDTKGQDMPAEFVIPNCKVQSNFTFTMASSGDPSTFTFTMDAFPDYTKFNKTKKVLTAIQIITDESQENNTIRRATDAYTDYDGDGLIDDNEELSLKTFKVDNIEYYYLNSMTWQDWVNSEYNTDQQIWIYLDKVCYGKNSTKLCLTDESPWNQIQARKYAIGETVMQFFVGADPLNGVFDTFDTPPEYTWGEWCNSEYNVVGASITDENYVLWNDQRIQDADTHEYITADMYIDVGNYYSTQAIGNITFMIADDGGNHEDNDDKLYTFTADAGMTWRQYCDSIFNEQLGNPFHIEDERYDISNIVVYNDADFIDSDKVMENEDWPRLSQADDVIKADYTYTVWY